MFSFFRKKSPVPAKPGRRCSVQVEQLDDRLLMATLASVSLQAPVRIPVPVDPVMTWIDQNIQDTSLRSVVRQAEADHVLGRTDMIAIMNQTASNGVVTSIEF